MYEHRPPLSFLFFFFNDTATTEIYTLSLHDALPICPDGEVEAACDQHEGHPHGDHAERRVLAEDVLEVRAREEAGLRHRTDRKSTRLNSSHLVISYAVFCLKKKNSPFRGCRGKPCAP